MEIFAIEGHKVKVTEDTKSNGYDYDSELVDKYLEIDKEYTVDHTVVNSYSTEVYLKEFPNIRLNSVNFEDVIKQSEEDDKLHPDYLKYNEQ